MARSKEMGISPDPAAEPVADAASEAHRFDPAKHPAVHVITERKGRGGKTATIIEGFVCDPEELKEVAASLKSALGTGGSARGGEILIQGDCRERVKERLHKMGFKTKG